MAKLIGELLFAIVRDLVWEQVSSFFWQNYPESRGMARYEDRGASPGLSSGFFSDLLLGASFR